MSVVFSGAREEGACDSSSLRSDSFPWSACQSIALIVCDLSPGFHP